MNEEGRPSRRVIPRRVSAKRWEVLAVEMRDALDNIEKLVSETYVDTIAVAKDGNKMKGKGWGVWVQPPHIAAEAGGTREGQFGILGTSAGLELMASTREFRNDTADERRRELILDAWTYLHTSLDKGPTALEEHATSESTLEIAKRLAGRLSLGKSAGEKVEGSEDFRRTLLVRQSQVLRCLSALNHHVAALINESSSGVSLQQNPGLAGQVLAEMALCREEGVPLSSNPGLGPLRHGSDAITVYRFSSEPWLGSEDNPKTRPETPIEWAYLWGSLLIGLTRSYLAYFIDAKRFNELVLAEELDQLAIWAATAARSDNLDELRVGLFAGWAIMQLEGIFSSDAERHLADLHNGGTGTIVDSNQQHLEARPSGKYRRRLEDALIRGAKKVIKEPSLQGDLHHPYSFHIAFEDGEPDRFRQDHLVVPTVPIALWLICRLDSRALFDVRVENLARKVAGSFEKADWRQVAPAQSSTYNGTVNMNYFHEALAEVHDLALRTEKRSRRWRRAAAIRRPWPTLHRWTSSPRLALGFGLLLVTAGPLVAWAWSLIGVPPHEVSDPPAVSSPPAHLKNARASKQAGRTNRESEAPVGEPGGGADHSTGEADRSASSSPAGVGAGGS